MNRARLFCASALLGAGLFAAGPQRCGAGVLDGTRVTTGPGADLVTGTPRNDVLRGGSGQDVIDGRAGRDTCRGETTTACERR